MTNSNFNWYSGPFVERLENDIIANPEYWLWSHKRWKRQKPADYKFNLNES